MEHVPRLSVMSGPHQDERAVVAEVGEPPLQSRLPRKQKPLESHSWSESKVATESMWEKLPDHLREDCPFPFLRAAAWKRLLGCQRTPGDRRLGPTVCPESPVGWRVPAILLKTADPRACSRLQCSALERSTCTGPSRMRTHTRPRVAWRM